MNPELLSSPLLTSHPSQEKKMLFSTAMELGWLPAGLINSEDNDIPLQT